MRVCEPPAVPYLSLYVKDLAFIEDGNPNIVSGQLVNWRKMKMFAGVLNELIAFQQRPYYFQRNPALAEHLHELLQESRGKDYNNPQALEIEK